MAELEQDYSSGALHPGQFATCCEKANIDSSRKITTHFPLLYAMPHTAVQQYHR